MTRLSNLNQPLMDAVMKSVVDHKADPVVAAGLLIDAAAALMATQPRLRNAADLRLTCEEARKRLKNAIRAHQVVLDERATRSPLIGPGVVQGANITR